MNLSESRLWDGRDIASLFALEAQGSDRFICNRFHANQNQMVYGGQSLALACAAAQATVEAHLQPTALQLNFLAPGALDAPMLVRVERVQQTRRFATRLVHLEQNDRCIAVATLAFHSGEDGMEHQCEPQPAAAPETLLNLSELRDKYFERLNVVEQQFIGRNIAVEIRPLEPESFLFERNPRARFRYWIRTHQPLALEIHEHYAALAYLSDFWFGVTALTPHREHKLDTDLYVSSLNHTLWFHCPQRADDWMLVDAQSPWAAQGRGLTFGSIHDRRGRLVASVSQEGLYRMR
ncbi:acyl-CoA thioesterase domain-containing protein [Pseudomonas asiatica]|uniref:acyl-CoA thioesterase n=1 Tax=Pseudomonas asiatica TaxID=2219225 RepID=UPI002E7ACF43|nr:acyl-CoA thioesterase domain-containing protein [Pseudomonas asiatica]MEE1916328.1 acyl-CoA thioesterase domain-containing protein [Pseudomonas asiatica]